VRRKLAAAIATSAMVLIAGTGTAAAAPSPGVSDASTYSGHLPAGRPIAHTVQPSGGTAHPDSGPSSCQGAPYSPVTTENAAGKYFTEFSTRSICFGDVVSITGHVRLQILQNQGLGNRYYNYSLEVQGHYPGTTSHWFYTAGQVGCISGTFRTMAWVTWTNSSRQSGYTNIAYSSGVNISC
jgi:hypothetical protein